MGRWSRTLAIQFVDWLQPATRVDWLELGCGTGALTAAICSRADPISVTACDPAVPFVDYARQNLLDARVTFVVAGADDFPFRAGGYDQITSLLALNFFPAPNDALQVMRAAACKGATVSACVWDYSAGMEFLRYFWDAALDVDPAAQDVDEGRRFPICTPDALTRSFRDAGLDDVQCDPLEIITRFESPVDYWTPFLGGTGPAPAFVASLDSEKVDLLRATLDRRLPRAADGTITLRARAWAVRGLRAGG
jgi:SAM-dependent methyltransferase